MVYAKIRFWWPPPDAWANSFGFGVNSRYPPHQTLGYRYTQSLTTIDRVPHRLWDLYSNRVIDLEDPFLIYTVRKISGNMWAVSHSWVPDSERHTVMTSINGHEWPVPIPNDTTLDHIRIELLNMGAEYVFLDVLCLRQEGNAEMEEWHRLEWNMDVPSMGHIYRHD